MSAEFVLNAANNKPVAEFKPDGTVDIKDPTLRKTMQQVGIIIPAYKRKEFGNPTEEFKLGKTDPKTFAKAFRVYVEQNTTYKIAIATIKKNS